MSNTGGSAPPMFADAAKFNGTNWATWSGLIQIAADLRGVVGYLDGTAINPLPPTTTTTTATTATAPPTGTAPITETSWESVSPTASEWRVRNAWAMGLLIYNTNNPVGLLGINIHGSACSEDPLRR